MKEYHPFNRALHSHIYIILLKMRTEVPAAEQVKLCITLSGDPREWYEDNKASYTSVAILKQLLSIFIIHLWKYLETSCINYLKFNIILDNI